MFNCDWTAIGTKKELLDQYGFEIGDVRAYWVETSQDTILIQYIEERTGPVHYRVSVWNRPGVRAEIAATLGFPVYYS